MFCLMILNLDPCIILDTFKEVKALLPKMANKIYGKNLIKRNKLLFCLFLRLNFKRFIFYYYIFSRRFVNCLCFIKVNIKKKHF